MILNPHVTLTSAGHDTLRKEVQSAQMRGLQVDKNRDQPKWPATEETEIRKKNHHHAVVQNKVEHTVGF
jgi:hypothetical protein